MDIYLSKEKIESFCGDIQPLQLLGVEEFGMEDITWRLEGDCLDLRTFTNPSFNKWDDGDFTDGVLLTFLLPGEARVIATYQGTDYVCRVVSREMKRASSEDDLDYFIGDLHIHTSRACSMPNNRTVLTTRADGSDPFRTVADIRDEGKMDFHVITDHASLLNRREFFRGFLAAEASGDDLVTFAGSECDVFSIEREHYGWLANDANEIVCLNTANYVCSRYYQEFLDGYANSPYIVCSLAHPTSLMPRGSGRGEHKLYKNCSARFRQMVKYVEVGNGAFIKGNMAHEYTYSLALDSGFHVSTACGSDWHGPSGWGYDCLPGKTIIMATEKSKEAFLDALLNNRAYASASGNVKVRYSVNGHTAPATLPFARNYRFHVQISYLEDIPDTKIIGGEVISNGGLTVKELEGDFSDMTFEIPSDTASWFFLRLWDEEGRKTWSVPVFTGREPYLLHNDDLEELPKTGVSIVEELTGKKASRLMCDDPFRVWKAEGKTASLLIDMKKEQTISALGHYGCIPIGELMQEANITTTEFLARFPFRYAVSTSTDGENFTLRAEGVFRVFCGDNIIRFAPHEARYIRLEILSTVGQNSHCKEYMDVPILMGELAVYRHRDRSDTRAMGRDRIERFENYLL